ncbi:MAG: hypothetical protein ABL995_17435 [Bryobacteraceae bacterium]
MKQFFPSMSLLFSLATLLPAQTMPLEPPHLSGNSVTGAFEGWFKNPDGTYNLLFGYYNRNQRQEVDVPIGPNNRIEPGGPDQGQPTHLLPGRNWGVFAVKVPADFGTKKLIWTLVANGQTTTVPGYLHTDYELAPFSEASVGNTPPAVGVDENGTRVQGPLSVTLGERTVKVDTPLRLDLWAEDDAKWVSNSGARPKVMPSPVVLHVKKYRGPGEITFGKEKPVIESVVRKDAKASAFNGKASTTAIFSEPGEYILHVDATDYSGEGGSGFQCCWTNAQMKVIVTK